MLQLSMEELYATRMARYVCAMHNGMPDRVPLRPFAAEITARHAGFTCQEVTHDYRKAFEAIIRCCHDYDWDATVPNMVYVWTGLTQAAGLTYYGVPGIDVEADVCFQYREPAEQTAFMKREEYDELIADPVRFLYETWLPRVSTEFSARGQAATFRNNLAFVKSSMAMMEYFTAFGPQVERMRRECGTVSAICGMLKAPLDILADKLRGYLGLAYDLMEIPEKVEQACRALMPHLGYLALTGADPSHQVPIPIWMHRGCTPFISKEHFERIYWPTLKPIVEALWAQGNQTLFYAEGKWDAHLESFAELPAHSIVYHLDRGNPERTHEVLNYVGLGEARYRNMETYSTGMLQRVKLAQALVHDPRALVLDEPTTSLDLRATWELREVLRKLAANGISILMVTHHLPDIIPEMRRVVLIRAGRVVMDGPKERVLEAGALSGLFGVPVEVLERGGYYHVL